MLDIYFEPNYGKLYENIENGESVVFKHESAYGKIQHMFIKREIPTTINGKVYYDIVTPYGYGGPFILGSGNTTLLVKEFEQEFEIYCKKNNIVSEFVRFHPIVKNYESFKDVYDIIYLRKTLGTNLKYDDPFLEEFSKGTRKTIRRILRQGVSYDIVENPQDVSSFMDVYYSTMNRNEAMDYYYFDRKYFESCIKYFGEQIVLVNVMLDNQVIASSFNFLGDQTLHVHLSGTLSEFLEYSPAYIIKYATMEWAKGNSVDLIHYGGGTSNSESDSLFKFKKKFSKNTEFEFNIGKKIWNEEVYDLLCKQNHVNQDTAFFPAYRSEDKIK